MHRDGFGLQLLRYLNDRGTNAGRLARAIGLSRAAVYNWRDGTSRPAPHHRDKVLACCRFLHLNEEETNRLLRAAGMKDEYPLDRMAPRQTRQGFIERLFFELHKAAGYPVLLFTRSGWGEPPFREALLAHARRIYASQATLHLKPSYAASLDACFAAIARQCGFDDAQDGYGFEQALEERLRGGELFLLVSRFEQGRPEFQERLAAILRGLSEMYPRRLHLILCGGERLAALKYQCGNLSLLNSAETLQWPELDADDVLDLYGRRYPAAAVSRSLAERLLRLCGSDPQLLDACFRLLSGDPRLAPETLPERLSRHECLWSRYVPLVGDAETRRQLDGLLALERVANAQPFLFDPFLRKLYWSNLLREHSNDGEPYLGWLCEAARLAGERVLAATRTDGCGAGFEQAAAREVVSL